MKKIVKPFQYFLAAALTVACLCSAAVPSSAEPKGTQLIATVDLLRIYGPDWTRYKTEIESIKARQDAYRAVVAQFLSDNGSDAAAPPIDVDTLGAWLKLKEQTALNPGQVTEANKKDLANYENQARAAMDRWTTLVNKGANLTPAEKTELAELQDRRTKANAFVVQKAGEYTTTLQGDLKTTQDKMEAEAQAAIAQVAQDQGITYVLNASVVSQLAGTQKIVLFSTDKNLDITDKVLKKLNK